MFRGKMDKTFYESLLKILLSFQTVSFCLSFVQYFFFISFTTYVQFQFISSEKKKVGGFLFFFFFSLS